MECFKCMTNDMPTVYVIVTSHAWLGCHACHTKGSSKREEVYLMIRKKEKATWSPKGCAKWPVNTRQFTASTCLVESRTNQQTGLAWPLAIYTNRIGSAQESLRPLESLIEIRKILPLSIEVLFVHEQFLIFFC